MSDIAHACKSIKKNITFIFFSSFVLEKVYFIGIKLSVREKDLYT